jgi:hypothetical protein
MGKRSHKPGADPGPPENVKSARVPVLLTPADYAALGTVAAQLKCSMAEVLRRDARTAGHLAALMPQEATHAPRQ